MPDLCLAAQQEQREHPLGRAGEDEGGDEQLVPWEPVGEDAAGEQEDNLREGSRREDEAQVGLRPGQLEHRERERGRRHPVPEERDDAAEEEEPELALGERPERPAPRQSRCSPCRLSQ
jgi:hypothetical protein